MVGVVLIGLCFFWWLVLVVGAGCCAVLVVRICVCASVYVAVDLVWV